MGVFFLVFWQVGSGNVFLVRVLLFCDLLCGFLFYFVLLLDEVR
jgi:hypothetical protein